MLDTMRRRMLGFGALVALGLLHLVFALVRLATAQGGPGVPFGGALEQLLFFLLSLGVMLFAVGMMFRGVRGPSGSGGLLSLAQSLVRGGISLLRTALRLAVAGYRQGSRAAQSAGQGELHRTVRRFRIRDMSGEVTACTLVGELVGPEVRQGDLIRVRLRGLRGGHVRIRRAEILSAPGGAASSVVTTRTARRFRLGVWADGTAWALTAVLAVTLCVQAAAVLS
ncbi:hypothetical protein [Streptomyces sp. NPDC054961]